MSKISKVKLIPFIFWFLAFIQVNGILYINTSEEFHGDKVVNTPTYSHQNCDDSVFPIVFVHGFLASGDSYEKQALRFMANGLCPHRLFMFDWNTVSMQDNTEKLDAFINEVLQKTDAPRVYLVGHSAGGGLSYSYMSQPERAKKIEAYVHIGARADIRPPGKEGEVPTLNIYSKGDPIVPGADIPGATNLKLTEEDHYQVVTSNASFEAIYEFFFQNQPSTNDPVISQRDSVTIAGKAVSLGENQPMDNAQITIFELDSESGMRLSDKPLATLSVDSLGQWGPVEVKTGAVLEYELHSEGRTVSYFRQAINYDNPFIYLRGLPFPSSIAGRMLSSLPSDDHQSVVVIFTSDRATVHGRDHLSVDGIELSTEDFATAANSSIAWFLFDANQNQKTDTTSIPTFALAPFLSGVDFFFDTTESISHRANFNGRIINFPNRKSASEGIVVIVFD